MNTFTKGIIEELKNRRLAYDVLHLKVTRKKEIEYFD